MENYTNKIYARKREDNMVIKFFSSVFEGNIDKDFLVEEGNEDYHAHVHLKYKLRDEDGRYNYKISEDKLIELTEEEKENLFPQAPPQIPEQERINAQLLQSDAQLLQSNAQQQLINAQLLKQIAELKGAK